MPTHALARNLALVPPTFPQVAENPGFSVCRADIDYLTAEITAMEPKLEAYQQLGLPMQLIHGDLHVRGLGVQGWLLGGGAKGRAV
jgi:hypothetical protein